MLINKNPRIFDVDLYGLAAVSAVMVLVWAGLLQPIQKKTIECRKQEQSTIEQQKNSLTKLTNIKGALKQKNTLAHQLSQSRNVLYENKGLNQVIGQIDRLAGHLSVGVDELKEEPPVVTDYCQKTPLRIELSGSFKRSMQLLSEVMETMPFVRIQTMNIAHNDNQPGLCNISLKLHVFSLKK